MDAGLHRSPEWLESYLRRQGQPAPTAAEVFREQRQKPRYDHDNASSQRAGAEPERSVQAQPLGQAQATGADPSRCVVRFTLYRHRLTDPDNGIVKWHLDALRYAQIIKDDREEDIDLQVSQVRVAHRADERTEITLTLP